MSELKATIEAPESTDKPVTVNTTPANKPLWETPKLEDVSEQVMAQPYIRFT